MLSMAAVGLGVVVGEGEGVSCGVFVGSTLCVGGTVFMGVIVFIPGAGDGAVAQAAIVKTITTQMHSTANIFQKIEA